jgi:aminoglycoside phosphotransferase (APT) family kinase protein
VTAVAEAGGRPVRAGEELDVAAAHAWLAARVPDLAGAPEVTQYAGGASNWTYRLRYTSASVDGRPHDFVLRRPPAGTKAKTAHDMGREFRIQQALLPAFPYVPRMVGLCDDEAVLGVPFYIMERVAGLIPRRELPPGVEWTRERTRELCLAMVDRLRELHRVDVTGAGLQALDRGPGYARRQVEGWSERYLRARTWNVPSFSRVRAWLAERVPEDGARCLIHNDYRFDNLVLDAARPERIVAVLDWEMATVGDPLMDLGAALAYWVQADDDVLARRVRRQPTHAPGMLTRAEVVARYFEGSPLRPPQAASSATPGGEGRRVLPAAQPAALDFRFFEVYGLFRVAVIAQQIYYRYHHHQTRNPAFRHFWLLVRYFEWRCRKVMRTVR